MLKQILRNGINYTVQGEGDPVILLHGIAASLYNWEALIPRLAGSGYRVYALDLPGHGESAKPDDPKDYHVQSTYLKLYEWIVGLDLPRHPILVCHSLGGFFGLLIGLLHPEQLRALVMIDPLYTPEQISPFLRILNQHPEWSSEFLARVPDWLLTEVVKLDPSNKNSFPANDQRHIADDYKRASPYIVYTSASIFDLTPQLNQIQTNTLVIWGQKDLVLSGSSFPRLVANMPKAKGQPLPGSGHQPHIGNPDLIHQLLVEFFDLLPVDDGLP